MADTQLKQIVDKLCGEIAVITGAEKNVIRPEKSIAANGINSLGFVELLLAIEKQYQLKLMENAMNSEDISSVSTLAAKIEKLINQK